MNIIYLYTYTNTIYTCYRSLGLPRALSHRFKRPLDQAPICYTPAPTATRTSVPTATHTLDPTAATLPSILTAGAEVPIYG